MFLRSLLTTAFLYRCGATLDPSPIPDDKGFPQSASLSAGNWTWHNGSSSSTSSTSTSSVSLVSSNNTSVVTATFTTDVLVSKPINSPTNSTGPVSKPINPPTNSTDPVLRPINPSTNSTGPVSKSTNQTANGTEPIFRPAILIASETSWNTSRALNQTSASQSPIPTSGSGLPYAQACQAASESWLSASSEWWKTGPTASSYSTYTSTYTETADVTYSCYTTLCDGHCRIRSLTTTNITMASYTDSELVYQPSDYPVPAPCSINERDCTSMLVSYMCQTSLWQKSTATNWIESNRFCDWATITTPTASPTPPTCYAPGLAFGSNTITSWWGPRSTGCGKCMVFAGFKNAHAQLIYFPPSLNGTGTNGKNETATKNMCATTITDTPVQGFEYTPVLTSLPLTLPQETEGQGSAVLDGTTYWANSAYIRFSRIEALDDCGNVGPALTSALVTLRSSDLLSVRGVHAYNAYSFNFADFVGQVPYIAQEGEYQCWEDLGNPPICDIIDDSSPYAPQIAMPQQVRTLLPEWRNCDISWVGISDPPIALTAKGPLIKPSSTAPTAPVSQVTPTDSPSNGPGPTPGGSVTDPGPGPTGPVDPPDPPTSTPPPGNNGPGQDPGNSDPGNNDPGNNDPGNNDPGNNNPGNNSPGNNSPGNNSPGNNSPGNNSPGNNSPGNNSPGNNSPGNNSPGNNGPGQNGPGNNNPGNNGPGQNGPGNNNPGNNAPGQNAPGQNNPDNPWNAPGRPITTVGPSPIFVNPSNGGVVVGSSTLNPGDPAITVGGTSISLGPGNLVIGSSTIPVPQPAFFAEDPFAVGKSAVVTVGGNVITAGPNGVVIGSTVLQVGGPAITTDGKTISLASSGVVVEENGNKQTVAFQPAGGQGNNVITVNGVPIMLTPNSVVIGSMTLGVGSPALTTNGKTITMGPAGVVVEENGQKQTIAYSPPGNASPNVITVNGIPITLTPNSVVIGSTTLSVGSPALTTNGKTITMGPAGVVVEGGGQKQTIAYSASGNANPNVITVSGIPITLRPDSMVIGTATLSFGGSAITVNGKTLSLGSSGLVVASQEGTTTIAVSRPSMPSSVDARPTPVGPTKSPEAIVSSTKKGAAERTRVGGLWSLIAPVVVLGVLGF